MIITVAHNFIQVEDGEQLEFLEGVFVLQRQGTSNYQASFKVVKYHVLPKYEAHQHSTVHGFDIALAEVELSKMPQGTLEQIYSQVTPICEIKPIANSEDEIKKQCGTVFLGGYPNEILNG